MVVLKAGLQMLQCDVVAKDCKHVAIDCRLLFGATLLDMQRSLIWKEQSGQTNGILVMRWFACSLFLNVE